jgi:hypothetical protein
MWGELPETTVRMTLLLRCLKNSQNCKRRFFMDLLISRRKSYGGEF